jgi:hypothetical protein
MAVAFPSATLKGSPRVGRKVKQMKTRPKKVNVLADLVATAWNDHAPDAEFAGMTLAQFRAATKASWDTRDALVSLVAQHRAKQDERNSVDLASRDTVQRVVAAVRSDPDYGSDSPLLAAMGYVTRSARKTGKTNKTNGNGQVNGNGNGNGTATAAVAAAAQK